MRNTTAVYLSASTPVMLIVGAVGLSVGSSYDVPRYTFAPGGVSASTGGEYEVIGAVGQPDAGAALTGGAFEATGGLFLPIEETDCNADGAVDSLDFAAFAVCFTGPAGATPEPNCRCFDVEPSGTVDLLDFAHMQAVFTAR